jgi:hypothetical protein
MQIPVRYVRIYALSQAQPTAPMSHPLSPIRLVNLPREGIETEIHLGAVPVDVLEALKISRAWRDTVLRGQPQTADELRGTAKLISAETVLADCRNVMRPPVEPHWYVTLIVKDEVELLEDASQHLYGVNLAGPSDLDRPDFWNRHTEALDALSVQAAIVVYPYRFMWLAWNDPLVQLPTGISLCPPKFLVFAPRAFSAAPLEQLNLSGLQSSAWVNLRLIPMVLYFYLQAATAIDRMERFFAAFRALERLSSSQKSRLIAIATKNSTGSAVKQIKAITLFRKRKRSIARNFAIMTLALKPADADVDLKKFGILSKWRNDLAHGNRKLDSNEAPDEETFELLHKYLAAI